MDYRTDETAGDTEISTVSPSLVIYSAAAMPTPTATVKVKSMGRLLRVRSAIQFNGSS